MFCLNSLYKVPKTYILLENCLVSRLLTHESKCAQRWGDSVSSMPGPTTFLLYDTHVL